MQADPHVSLPRRLAGPDHDQHAVVLLAATVDGRHGGARSDRELALARVLGRARARLRFRWRVYRAALHGPCVTSPSEAPSSRHAAPPSPSGGSTVRSAMGPPPVTRGTSGCSMTRPCSSSHHPVLAVDRPARRGPPAGGQHPGDLAELDPAGAGVHTPEPPALRPGARRSGDRQPTTSPILAAPILRPASVCRSASAS
ncbi:unnamed protein product [Prorocentrum cordatum]|uniref:Uncharacterized protein n=1 Tax=Prorocentrum cordatum TaxID=2364126 RepID=A0ABN9TVL3_9DINO|nr:unnamed protein product [Polarella glacialis]